MNKQKFGLLTLLIFSGNVFAASSFSPKMADETVVGSLKEYIQEHPFVTATVIAGTGFLAYRLYQNTIDREISIKDAIRAQKEECQIVLKILGKFKDFPYQEKSQFINFGPLPENWIDSKSPIESFVIQMAEKKRFESFYKLFPRSALKHDRKQANLFSNRIMFCVHQKSSEPLCQYLGIQELSEQALKEKIMSLDDRLKKNEF